MDITKETTVLNVYLHGSRVYGTATQESDYDYIVVVDPAFWVIPRCGIELASALPNNYKEDQPADVQIYNKEDWDKMAQENNCDFLECICQPDSLKLKETYVPDFILSKEKIRCNFSAKASNSWVKCKKKLTVEKDYSPYIGKKSLWHSLRLVRFGIQLLKHGKIVDYSELNPMYKEIVFNESNDWEYYKAKYQPIYNSYKTEFRLAENQSTLPS